MVNLEELKKRYKLQGDLPIQFVVPLPIAECAVRLHKAIGVHFWDGYRLDVRILPDEPDVYRFYAQLHIFGLLRDGGVSVRGILVRTSEARTIVLAKQSYPWFTFFSLTLVSIAILILLYLIDFPLIYLALIEGVVMAPIIFYRSLTSSILHELYMRLQKVILTQPLDE